jgi:hypothetical protein
MHAATVAIIMITWLAVWGLADTLTEDLSRSARQRLYGGILLAVVLVICFYPALLDRF